MKIKHLLITNISLFSLFSDPLQAQNSSFPTIINNNNSPFQQKLIDWGFSISNCDGNVVSIRDLNTQEIACVKPNQQISSGNYVYDRVTNQIRPDTNVDSDTANVSQTNTRGASQNIEEVVTEGYVNPNPSNADPRIADVVIDFVDIYGYNNCLDALLLLYEGRNPVGDNSCLQNVKEVFGNQISRDVMLELVDIANVRATSLLPMELYPAYGIRRRVAQSVGYVYEIDVDNPEMIRLAQSSGRN
ncbi:hypothetical protein [Cyanobacterium aponinum]|uniref:hypothetical protein n=1 Tax=Cyanobacterium aponinum TaxID=379064 RepID=UPI000C12D1E1|nr:hypothetical protein [Cyanobacterium aponinum]PHV62586.1 hypothetical protein CSQ80_10000 [Cyanobacterium aponinum IPPAS B-1201]